MSGAAGYLNSVFTNYRKLQGPAGRIHELMIKLDRIGRTQVREGADAFEVSANALPKPPVIQSAS